MLCVEDVKMWLLSSSVSHQLSVSSSCLDPCFTHYLYAHSVGCYLWCAPYLAPSPPPCSSPPVASSPDLSHPLCYRGNGTPVMADLAAEPAWIRAGSWFWPLCQRRRNRPRIFLRGTERRRGETRSPRGSRPEDRMFGPGRWRRSAPQWRSWSPAAQSQLALGLSSRHLEDRREKQFMF